MRYLGVSRAETYSPNRVGGDAAVLRAVASELEHHGNEVICISEQELAEKGIPAGIDCIFQMVRSSEALAVLEQAGDTAGMHSTGILRGSGHCCPPTLLRC